MGASKLVLIAASFAMAGCGTVVVHPGLANGPGLGGTTPETRVHDAVANGRDACERAAFPPGEVLRGQIPPCDAEAVRWTLPVAPPPPIPAWTPGLYARPSCPPGSARDRELMGMTAFPLSGPGWRLACGAGE